MKTLPIALAALLGLHAAAATAANPPTGVQSPAPRPAPAATRQVVPKTNAGITPKTPQTNTTDNARVQPPGPNNFSWGVSTAGNLGVKDGAQPTGQSAGQSGSNGAGNNAKVQPPGPNNYSFGATQTGTDTAITSPRDVASGQATGVKSPRDVASGQSSGKAPTGK